MNRHIVAAVLAVITSGCSGSQSATPPECTAHSSQVCADGAMHWVNSCGDREEQAQSCACGCSTDEKSCRADCCTPDCGSHKCGPVPNGCGASCGDCPSGASCRADGLTCEVFEKEAQNGGGANDAFAKAEPIPLGVDVVGYIGVANDKDWYQFNVEQVGTVKVTLEHQSSVQAQTIQIIETNVQILDGLFGPAGGSTSVVDSSKCFDRGTQKGCVGTSEFIMSVTPTQKTYQLSVEADVDLDTDGFDSHHPYRMHLEFIPGKTLETDEPAVDGIKPPEADVWQEARPLTFDQGDEGVAVIHNYGWYFDDVDWFKFTAPKDGWLRGVADTSMMEDGDAETIAFMALGTLYRKTATGFADAELNFVTSESPNCSVAMNETQNIRGGETYYLRTYSLFWSKTKPYNLTIEYRHGGPEDTQLGAVGAADSPSTAYAVPALTPGVPTTVTSYVWHYFDLDYFKIHVPAGKPGTLKVDLDYSAIYKKFGWGGVTGCLTHPFGIEIWEYLYDGTAPWVADPDLSAFIGHGYEDDQPTQTMSATVQPDHDYYVLVVSHENWDQQNPYALKVTFTPQP